MEEWVHLHHQSGYAKLASPQKKNETCRRRPRRTPEVASSSLSSRSGLPQMTWGGDCHKSIHTDPNRPTQITDHFSLSLLLMVLQKMELEAKAREVWQQWATIFPARRQSATFFIRHNCYINTRSNSLHNCSFGLLLFEALLERCPSGLVETVTHLSMQSIPDDDEKLVVTQAVVS